MMQVQCPLKTACSSSSSSSSSSSASFSYTASCPSITIHCLRNITQCAALNVLLSFITKSQTLLKSHLAVVPIRISTSWAGGPARVHSNFLQSIQWISFISKPDERLERWRQQTEISVNVFKEQGDNYIRRDMKTAVQ